DWSSDVCSSDLSNPAVICKRPAASLTVFVIGPTWSRVQASGKTPYLLTRPYVCFSPTIPQAEDGILIDPAVSVPKEAMVASAATAAPEPPLEPPGILFIFQGFLTGPKCGLLFVIPHAYSCKLTFPVITTPAFSNFFTTVASKSDTKSL